MSGDRATPVGCEAVSEVLSELALGTLMGRRRVAVLTHVDACPRCAADLRPLSTVVDELVLLGPSLEPPVGFEARVFDRLNLHPPRRRGVLRLFSYRRGLGASVAAAVAAAVFVVGLVVGHGATAPGPGGAVAQFKGTAVQVAELDADGHGVGEALVYAGHPTWLLMYVDDSAWREELSCEVTLDRGPAVVVGKFWLSDGDGAWATKVAVPARRLRQARILSPDGTVLATAALAVSLS
jgi:hypothetical protein